MNMNYKSREDSLEEFHKAFGHPVDEVMTVDGMELRRSLIVEEFTELMSEISQVSIALARGRKPTLEVRENLLKELCDLQYVISGMAVAFGLPLQIAFNRVHSSNMSKLGEDGKPLYREDGKVLKGPNYEPPDLKDLVA
jgi:predicted HAD superfamily Cof-like phosphohydrolase|tara:strand:+ start:136 stop:552 length:417 start_codon:yes stop_codon:yes gene_type:complete